MKSISILVKYDNIGLLNHFEVVNVNDIEFDKHYDEKDRIGIGYMYKTIADTLILWIDCRKPLGEYTIENKITRTDIKRALRVWNKGEYKIFCKELKDSKTFIGVL